MLFCLDMRTCFLFPGQGAQYAGMGKDLWDSSHAVRELFGKASKASGMDMPALLFEGTDEDLDRTDRTQVAVTLMNLSSSLVLGEKGVRMEGCAGFSLGEYAALCEAGVIDLEDLFPIVKIRGEAMEKASRNLDSAAGAPGMAAVLGLSADAVSEAVGTLGPKGVFLANLNSPSQAVVSGSFEGLAEAERVLKAAGAKRFMRLRVSGPFHSPLLKEAAEALGKALESFTFSEPRIPVYSNVTGKRIASGAEARQLCARQVVSTVRWVDVEKSLLADGFSTYVESGPGAVLTGLFKALQADLNCAPAGTMKQIEKLVAPAQA